MPTYTPTIPTAVPDRPMIFSSFITSSRPAGRSISMPTISMATNELALASGSTNVATTAGIFTLASMSTIMTR